MKDKSDGPHRVLHRLLQSRSSFSQSDIVYSRSAYICNNHQCRTKIRCDANYLKCILL